MPFERYEILLPLKYNDGTAVEPEKFQATRRELVEQFGALTMDAPPVSGLTRVGFFRHDTDPGAFLPLPPGEGGGEGVLCDATILPSP